MYKARKYNFLDVGQLVAAVGILIGIEMLVLMVLH